MRPRSDFPGLQRQRLKSGAEALYWVASRAAVAAGYPLKTVRLHGYAAGSAELAARCADLQAQMTAWLAEQGRDTGAPIVFAGRVADLVDLYETHPDSPYRELSATSRRSYGDMLRLIRRTVGDRLVARLNGLDFRRWHRNFRSPRAPGRPERVRQAHFAMTVVRILFSFGALLKLPHCRELRDMLSEMRFADAPARESQVTFDQVTTFIAKAHELGFPEMALAQALQFESTLRQWDVIGEWERDTGQTKRRAGWRWSKGLLWSELGRDRILSRRTTKTDAAVTIDLNAYPLVMAELDRADRALPIADRIGPVIVDPKTGEPYKRRAYSGRWRTIAQAAGIPDDIWNRDSRAGGITEALDAGAALDDVRQHAGHAEARTTQRYNRDTLAKTARVARLRVAHRQKEGK